MEIRALCEDYGVHIRSATKILRKFEETVTVADIVRTVDNRFARSTSNVGTVGDVSKR